MPRVIEGLRQMELSYTADWNVKITQSTLENSLAVS